MTKVTVSDAAEMLGVNKQAVRIGLQRGVYDFGVAFKNTDYAKKFTYIFYPERLKELVGSDRYEMVMRRRQGLND